MLGFAVYLNNINADYIRRMTSNGFSFIFTSLQIPEESHEDIFLPLKNLIDIAKDTLIIADINPEIFNQTNEWLQKECINQIALRFDESVDIDQLLAFSKHSKIVLNASTDAIQIINQLQNTDIDMNQIIVMHNYYPRPETGLDTEYMLNVNTKLKASFPNINIMAFVCGTEFRGPLFRGVPTLENHRLIDPLVAAHELTFMNVDDICIADTYLNEMTMYKMNQFFNKNILSLNVQIDSKYEFLTQMVLHNRPEVSRDVIRIVEGRKKLSDEVVPFNTIDRTIGSITIDNCNYGRYMNEIQITKYDLQQDEKVNVIGHVCERDVQYLELVGPNQAIKLTKE